MSRYPISEDRGEIQTASFFRWCLLMRAWIPKCKCISCKYHRDGFDCLYPHDKIVADILNEGGVRAWREKL